MIKRYFILHVIFFPFFSIGCSTPEYILNDNIKNTKTSNEMAVLILNQDITVNAIMSQRVASLYNNNKGYVTSTSILSNQFIKDGFFEKLYNGEKFNFSKQKINKYVDYLCLGKLSTIVNISNVSENMFQATVTLELRIVNTLNGGSINNISKYKSGIGFTKQQAIEVAEDAIINDLK